MKRITIETLPALVDPPHPITNPCQGCPRTYLPGTKLVIAHHTKRAYWNGVDVELTGGQYRVLALLVSATGEFVSYRQIYDVIQYPGFHAGCPGINEGWRTNVRSMIKRIRISFYKLDPSFDAIRNYQGFGYSFVTGPVTTMEGNGGKETSRSDS